MSLRVIFSNKRKNPRYSFGKSNEKYHFKFRDSRIDIFDLKYYFDSCIFKTNSNIFDRENINGKISILDENENIEVENWVVSRISRNSKNVEIAITCPERDFLKSFRNDIDFNIIKHSSWYKRIEINSFESNHLFTEISECSHIKIRLRSGNYSISGFFNFDSKFKNYTKLFITPDESVEINTFKDTTVEFNFNGYRYLLNCSILNYDNDFNVIELKLKSDILVIAARQHFRWEIDKSINLEYLENTKLKTIKCRAVSVSIESISIEIPEFFLCDNKTFNSIYLNDKKVQLSTEYFIKDEKTITLFFYKNISNLASFLSFIIKTVNESLIFRNKDNQTLFFNLYKNVGYIKDSDKEEEVITTWNSVDSVIPGSCIGIVNKNNLEASCGILPFSKDTSYGHSLCMLRNGFVRKNLQDLLQLNLGISNFFNNLSFWCGSFAKHSKFTPRLYMTFEEIQAPSTSRIIRTVQIENLKLSDKIEYKQSKKDIQFLKERFKKESPLSSELNCKINVNDSIYKFSGPKHLTAANMFNYKWVLSSLSEENCAKLEDRVQIPCETFSFKSDSTEYKEIDWFFAEKRFLGPITSSIIRTISRLIRKYDEDEL